MRAADADTPTLSEDPAALRALLLEAPSLVDTLTTERDALSSRCDSVIAERDALAEQNERLRHLLLKLQRRQFGRKSERLTDEQLQFAFEEIEATLAENTAEAGKRSPAMPEQQKQRRWAGRGRLPAHLPEIEQVLAPGQGPSHVARLISHVEDPTSGLLSAARSTLGVLIEVLKSLDGRIRRLDTEIVRRAKQDEVVRRLASIPGVGQVTATALAALAPAAETFRKGRDFAAWMGLTPLQRSTGGKQKLGRTSKMGERTLRRLLIIGASSVVQQASRCGAPEGAWLAQMLSRKPRMLVVVALANKMARTVWALLTKGETYRSPAVAASS